MSTTRLNKSYPALKTGVRVPLALEEAKCSIRPEFFATVSETNRKVLHGNGSKQISQRYRTVFPEFFLILPKSTNTRFVRLWLLLKVWQNTSYEKLGGKNNWFYAVMKIFAQQSNTYNPNFGGMEPSSAPTRLRVWQQLLTVWFWSFCGICKSVDCSRRPRKENLAWLAKSATNSKKSSWLTRSLRLHHTNLSRKVIFW